MATVNEPADVQRKVDLLRRVPLISEVDSAKLEILAFTSETRTFKSGQVVFKQGELGDEAYVIASGEVEIITEGPEGEVAIATLGANQIIGEIAILVDVPRTATVVAMTELTTLVITKDSFYRMVTAFPSIAVAIMRELASRIALTTVQVREVHAGAEPQLFSR